MSAFLILPQLPAATAKSWESAVEDWGLPSSTHLPFPEFGCGMLTILGLRSLLPQVVS